MKYSELIELYKNGKLEPEEKERVENDIDRQVAISEYLFDSEEIPELGDIEINSESDNGVNSADEQIKFMKMIKSSIRKAFIKSGIIVGAIVLAICLFIIYALPKLVDEFYYNPNEIVTNSGELDTNRISLDIMAYTELFVPGYFRSEVDCDANGYGNYDINIRQTSSYTGLFIDVAGEIDKGNLRLYDNNLLKMPTGNAFMPSDDVLQDFHAGMGPAGTSKESFEELDELNDSDYYIAYVTLDKVMSYKEFANWAEENNATPTWCAMCQMDDEQQYETDYFVNGTIGFIYSSSCSDMEYDKERYPYLTYFDATTTTGEGDNWVVSEEVMEQHVISLLSYIKDQKEFREMMELYYEDDELEEMIEDIKDNGLNVYGYVTIGNKDDLAMIKDMDGLEYVYTRPLR